MYHVEIRIEMRKSHDGRICVRYSLNEDPYSEVQNEMFEGRSTAKQRSATKYVFTKRKI